jgi:hypothetical protein
VNPPEFARHWAQELDSSHESLVKLRGGINNNVFRCGTRARSWVIKGYPSHYPGYQNRMQAEVEFLRYSAIVAPGRVPELIAVDNDRSCVVLEHLEGETFPEGVRPPEAAVVFAVDFFRQLNADLSVARQMISMDAAEGFLSLTEHICNIQQRLDEMTCDHLPIDAKPQATQLLTSMRRKHEHIRKITENKISRGRLKDAIEPEERCVSPSDFGFHNAIWTQEGVKFIDFEFSGWDDPAKTLLDFILQPRIPVQREPSPLRASVKSVQTIQFEQRYEALKPILYLKWLCIILSFLSKNRLEKLTRQTPSKTANSIISERLSTAVSYAKATTCLSIIG